ncbi:MAG TPA: hypothetical protein PK096_00735 [Candidatus Saccharibacteria bacterium]|nr:hypothetical protein [Candidatus Saccharibacteria bacterium]HRK93879.1 hypothetical protein [Candidatus Saccharibacteria bacterium]
MDNENKVQHHLSQLFSLPDDDSFDFFDTNLEFDTPVFIDPFLLKNSPVEAERKLFERFGDFFRYAYDQSFQLSIGKKNVEKFARLLTFPEPRSIYMGYTEASNRGHGANLTTRLLRFFLESSAKEYVRETKYFPEELYNPISLQVFTDGVGPDAISDITANLIMDYLIEYTVEQANKWNIELKPRMALDRDGFDFDENTWKSGGYYNLPANPLNPSEPVIFVPKHLLRGIDEIYDDTKSRVFSILRSDTGLSEKFSDLLNKSLKKVTMDEVREVFLQEGSVHYRFLKQLQEDRSKPYDFKTDYLGLLADKNYVDYFEGQDLGSIQSCEMLKNKTRELLSIFDDDHSRRDGWKDAWKERKGTMVPQAEVVIGRKFRGMGYAYFSHFPEVTFIAEAGTGNGFVDFQIIYRDCRIVVELKLLSNASLKGHEPKIPAYVHGLTRQLPEYAYNTKAKHAFYVTGQHYDGKQNTGVDHTPRIKELEGFLPEIEKALKENVPGFESLTYLNVKMMPHGSSSNA